AKTRAKMDGAVDGPVDGNGQCGCDRPLQPSKKCSETAQMDGLDGRREEGGASAGEDFSKQALPTPEIGNRRLYVLLPGGRSEIAASLKDFPEATAWCREGDKVWQPVSRNGDGG